MEEEECGSFTEHSTYSTGKKCQLLSHNYFSGGQWR